jgi:hypothetical protein
VGSEISELGGVRGALILTVLGVIVSNSSVRTPR